MMMTAEELEYHLEVGRAIAALLEPMARVMAVIHVGRQHGWTGSAPEYVELLQNIDRDLTKLLVVSAVTAELQAQNEAYVKADGETWH